MHSNALQLTVHNQSSGGNAKNPGFNPMPDPSWPAARPQVDMDELVKPGENVADKIRKNFFIKVDVSKTDCYLGEPIVATYKLYARLRSDSRVTRHPSLNGFSVYDMIDPSDDRVSVEKINGKNFSVHIIRKTQLIPLQSGDITMDAVELDNNIYLIKADANTTRNPDPGLGGLLDRLFEPEVSGTPFTQHIVLESKPVTIHVKPLPEAGKPVNFNGAVGKYTMQASLNTKVIDTGDAAILTINIKGSGNLPVINAPEISWPKNMESYDVSNKENIDKTSSPLSGSKTFNYSFICTKPGSYELAPVKMSYFDPATTSYKTILSEPLQIQVNQAKKMKNTMPPSTPDKTIHTDWIKIALWSAVFLLFLGAAIFIYRQSKKDEALKQGKAIELAALEKFKQGLEMADTLKESREFMRIADFGKFYASINRAIWKSVSDKLRLPASELNKLNIASGLRNSGWSDEEIIQLKNILNECEMKLYTPDYNTSDMHRVFASAEMITSRLNRRLI
jgi:BatD DUF11 like domain